MSLTLDADEECDHIELTEGHPNKQRRRGKGRIHDLSGDQSDVPEVTPHAKSSEAVMKDMLLMTTEYLRSQCADTSSSSPSNKKAERDDYTFAQRIQLEEMKSENLKLQYKVLLLEKSSKDSA